VNPSKPIRDFLDALVHPSARHDPVTAERHVAFMAPRLCGSLLALGTFPVVLAVHGVPNAVEFLVLAWMIVPIAIACFLSRTGRYDAAQGLSAFALTCVVTLVAAGSGGMHSFAAIWLVLIPLEAALSGSRRAVVTAALLAVGGAGLLVVAGAWFGLQPGVEHSSGLLMALGTLSALVYATGIALGADGVALWKLVKLGHDAEQQRLSPFAATDVITHHSHGGRIVYASENAQAVLGAPAADLFGYGLFDRIHIADRPAYLRALSEAAATGDTCEIEFRLRQPTEATYIWIEMRCRPWDGRPAATSPEVIAVMRDVTERKARQDALVAARAEAERANAAKSRFLASIGHELRTPLNAIIGFSDMLHDEAGPAVESARRLEYARIISQSGHHLLAVVNDILDMSRLESGHFELFPEPFALAAVIAGCADMLARGAQADGVALTIDVPADLPGIVADRRAVTQILINLIANAVKFTGHGGTVTVSARIDGERVRIEVADTGIGMAPDDLARIGHPFLQARGACSHVRGARFEAHDALQRGGAGLGLSIVKGLVDLHGGDLEAASEEGNGTRMVVRLPVDCERTAAERGAVPITRGMRSHAGPPQMPTPAGDAVRLDRMIRVRKRA
jgi:two-component system, cell cycle sensor histidine kinase DivJ